MYNYKAIIIAVYDGDTFTIQIDLGFSITITEKLRLYGVDTPEIRLSTKTTLAEKKRGLVVRDYVRKLILGETVNITVHKKGKYGRYVAQVFYGDKLDTDLSKHLVKKGMAVKINY